AFYTNERLLPQIKLAVDSNLLNTNDLKEVERLCKQLGNICPTEPATLIHGDLWSGNYVAAGGEEAVLIDPSVSYAHREMDLAMTQLFGGFERSFYYHYQNIYPLEMGYEERVPIYQLYYLLVHVNLFGGSYVDVVRKILQRF
ncbi:MAG: fructosamine kinase family protein, partial [Saprospiraceae bacterium]